MKRAVDSIGTESVINYFNCHFNLPGSEMEEASRYAERVWELTSAVHMAFKSGQYVSGHKEIFGKQDYCFTSWHRYWVWHGPNDRWRIFISNKRGIYFEVNSDLIATLPEAIECFEEYAERVLPAT